MRKESPIALQIMERQVVKLNKDGVVVQASVPADPRKSSAAQHADRLMKK